MTVGPLHALAVLAVAPGAFVCDTTQPPPGAGGVAGSGRSTTGGGWLADDGNTIELSAPLG